ncbi:MAG: PAS domain S-box protein [Phycisphaerae bacterium]|nr:PAS domain S-box protein [Phycisphaerae bacterium]
MPTSEPMPPAPCEGDGTPIANRRDWDPDTAQNPRYRVLLVEDDRIDQIIFRRFVRDAGLSYDYAVVGSVSEAQEMLRWSPPFDIVISDYLLGDGTAFDILDLVKEAPVILVTGAGGEETAVRAWKAGAYDYLVKDAQGDYLQALAITVENAIEHRRTKKELELLSGAIMSTNDCIYITDMQGKIIFANEAFCRTYGYTQAQILGKDSSILWTGGHPRTPTGCVLGIQTAGGGSAVGFYHERQGGGRFPVSLSRSIIKDSNGHDVAVVGIARDLSERLLLMDEFCAEIAGLEAHNQRYRELTITLLQTLDSLLAKNNIGKALRIIMDFRKILEIEMEGVRLERTDLNLGPLTSQIVDTLRPAAGEKNVELTTCVPETELMVHANGDHAVQALTCIVRSLIYLLPGKSRISIRTTDAEQGITVEIGSDDALGAIRKIYKAMEGFDSFGGHADPHGDLVLGLFAAKRLVELHGGTMDLDGGSPEGDILSITLLKSREVPRDSTLLRSGADQH